MFFKTHEQSSCWMQYVQPHLADLWVSVISSNDLCPWTVWERNADGTDFSSANK